MRRPRCARWPTAPAPHWSSDLPDEEVLAEVDPRRIERILRNLLTNALDHGEGHPVEVIVAADSDAVAVLVRDHGIGLEPGQQDLVFTRFWRGDPSRDRRTGGTGLGLSISLEDARLHGGWLQAWGAPGQGSAFRLTLPRSPGIELTRSPLPLGPPGGSPRDRTPRAGTSRAGWTGALTMPRRLLPILVTAVLIIASVVGCGAVPESSDLQVVRSMPVGSGSAPTAGPERGVDPFRLVREFIEATGSPADGHAAARAFLSRGAAATWNDRAGLTVIEDAPGAAPQAGPADGVRRIRVSGSRLGVLTADGSFTPAAGTFSIPLDVISEHGEWRITNPPPGVLVEASAVQRNYRQVRVNFVDPNRGTLVPDLRWVAAQPASTLPGRVLDLLLTGPSERLAGAVRTSIPGGTRLRSNVLVSRSGRTVINLSGVDALTDAQRRLAAAQIVSSLDGLVPAPMRLLADGEPMVAAQAEWRSADSPPTPRRPGRGPTFPGRSSSVVDCAG